MFCILAYLSSRYTYKDPQSKNEKFNLADANRNKTQWRANTFCSHCATISVERKDRLPVLSIAEAAA